MERRQHKRFKVSLKAERISGDSKHAVFIEDISEQGIQIITTPSLTTLKKFTTGSEIILTLKVNAGKSITLHCKTRWAYHKMPPERTTDCIGLQIIDPPQEYLKFIKSLPNQTI